MSDWNPILYTKFEAERMRAARDLLARIPLAYDLGCGPGNSAELLLRRFPDARTIGLDTSDAMLADARARAPKAEFVKEDIAGWAPGDKARPDLRGLKGRVRSTRSRKQRASLRGLPIPR